MKAIEELSPQVGTAAACRSLGVPRATLYRHRQPKPRRARDHATAHAAAGAERPGAATGRSTCSTASRSPTRPRPRFTRHLLDQGQYLCSIRTMYRILDDRQEVRERRDQLRHPTYHKPQLVATAPNQVWSWDITKLLGPAKWTYFHLYVILDIFSRYVVGWMLARRESEHLAERLIRETVVKQGIVRDQLTIHSDRGPSMRSQTVAQLLATLGITKSHSRPHVSDDNPFSESQFKTLKYRPEFPDRFASIEHGLDFCGKFFHWQNHEHHHWGLGLLTPATVHYGQADTVLAARQAVLTAAHAAHPERFVRQPPRPLALPSEVWINPPADGPEPRMLQLPRDTNFVPQLSQTH